MLHEGVQVYITCEKTDLVELHSFLIVKCAEMQTMSTLNFNHWLSVSLFENLSSLAIRLPIPLIMKRACTMEDFQNRSDLQYQSFFQLDRHIHST